jgi:hypothetical protein
MPVNQPTVSTKTALWTVFCLVSLFTFGGAAQNSCLPEGITFSTQEQIDSFSEMYPGCNDILGSVLIQGSDITSLSGLMQISMIRNDLQITNTSMLVSLEGLNNLWFIGIGSAQLYGLNITENTALTSLQGINSLNEVTGALQIGSNPLITDLHGLENLETTGSFVLIFNNESLSDITGLRKLSTIRGNLILDNLPALNSLKGIDNIDANSISGLRIKSSNNLTFCHVTSICEYLAAGGLADIRLNGSGCESREEVETGCLTSLGSETLDEPGCIYPNPSKGTFYIKENCAETGDELEVISMNGKLMHSARIDTGLQLSFNNLPKGIYYLKLHNSRISKYFLLVII